MDCGKLEIIRDWVFYRCDSLRSINLPSVEVVEEYAFRKCDLRSVPSVYSKILFIANCMYHYFLNAKCHVGIVCQGIFSKMGIKVKTEGKALIARSRYSLLTGTSSLGYLNSKQGIDLR